MSFSSALTRTPTAPQSRPNFMELRVVFDVHLLRLPLSRHPFHSQKPFLPSTLLHHARKPCLTTVCSVTSSIANAGMPTASEAAINISSSYNLRTALQNCRGLLGHEVTKYCICVTKPPLVEHSVRMQPPKPCSGAPCSAAHFSNNNIDPPTAGILCQTHPNSLQCRPVTACCASSTDAPPCWRPDALIYGQELSLLTSKRSPLLLLQRAFHVLRCSTHTTCERAPTKVRNTHATLPAPLLPLPALSNAQLGVDLSTHSDRHPREVPKLLWMAPLRGSLCASLSPFPRTPAVLKTLRMFTLARTTLPRSAASVSDAWSCAWSSPQHHCQAHPRMACDSSSRTRLLASSTIPSHEQSVSVPAR